MKEKTHTEAEISRELEMLTPGITDDKVIDVDNAWHKVESRISADTPLVKSYISGESRKHIFSFRIAAGLLILAALGATAVWFWNNDLLSKTITISTGNDQKSEIINMPDGSLITLNRNTTLSYKEGFGKRNRKVALDGEAFFNIEPDPSKPFTIDAGKANVTVVGTTFNVITDNRDSAVEVFVTSGKVLLSDLSGERGMTLEPGYIGTMNQEKSGKSLNNNPNYLSWNTGKLLYDGQTLDVVFSDLKRVYNMEISADDPEIYSNKWTAPIDIQSTDTIIRLICTSFNLSYYKDGNVYRLSKK